MRLLRGKLELGDISLMLAPDYRAVARGCWWFRNLRRWRSDEGLRLVQPCFVSSRRGFAFLRLGCGNKQVECGLQSIARDRTLQS